MTAVQMDALFEGRRVPRWLREFERDPERAVADLLVGRADFGHLNAAEPSDLLLDWLRALGGPFVTACDAALVRFVDLNWGRPLPSGRSVSAEADTWVCLADVIAGHTGLSRAATALRERFLAERHVLAALVEGRSRDPEGRAWLALARHQEDRRLLSEWWRLCRLPPEEPWYRGMYGIHGLQELPPAKGQGRGFVTEVAEGLRVLALALLRREEQGWLRPNDGRDEFLPLARLTMAAYPFPPKWRTFWSEVLQRDQEHGAELEHWVRQADPTVIPRPSGDAHDGRGRQPRGVRLRPDPSWPDRASALRKQLGAGSDTAAVVAVAQVLLAEQEAYARLTGDTHFVVRSACNFAARLRHTDAAQAFAWVHIAREFEPWNAYAWATSAECALALGRPDEARDYALEATRRFPDNPVARNGLAEVLKAQGDLDEAEAVYREACARFPDDPVARTGLGDVLRARGKLDEAAVLYRESLERWPHSRKTVKIAEHGLEVIRQAPRTGAATTAVAPRAEHARDDRQTATPPPSGRQPAAAAADEAATPALHREDVPRLLADAYLLRRWGLRAAPDASRPTPGRLRQRARGLLAALQPRLERDARAAAAVGLLELTLGELDEATLLLREAARRFPGSARVRYALARAGRALAEREPPGPDVARSLGAPWQRLERLDLRFRPLALLGEGRAWLALRDGRQAEEQALAKFGQLGYWISRRDTGIQAAEGAGFATWWSAEVRGHVFGQEHVTCAEELHDMPALRARIEREAPALDRLEEDFVDRFAAA